jgi:hypothetical protein
MTLAVAYFRINSARQEAIDAFAPPSAPERSAPTVATPTPADAIVAQSAPAEPPPRMALSRRKKGGGK